MKRPDPLHHFIATSDTLHEAAGKDNSQDLEGKKRWRGVRRAKYHQPTQETPNIPRAPSPDQYLLFSTLLPTAPAPQMTWDESQGCLSPPQRQCPGLLQPPPAYCSSARTQSSPHSPEGWQVHRARIPSDTSHPPPLVHLSLLTLDTFQLTPTIPLPPPHPWSPTSQSPNPFHLHP